MSKVRHGGSCTASQTREGWRREPQWRVAEVVCVDGAGRDVRAANRASLLVAEALEAEGIEVCLHHRDRCDRLAGTGNVQSVAARTTGAQFVHLELARPLRSSPEGRDRFVAALARVLSATP